MTASMTADEEALARWELVLRAISRTQERVLERVEAAGIPAQWFTALHLLLHSKNHRLPMSRLARELSMTSGGFTKLADRMGQDGLIDRRNSSGDRRVVYATLTDRGLRLARRTERLYSAAVGEHVLKILTDANLSQLAEAVRPLGEAHAKADAPDEVPVVVPVRDSNQPERRRRAHRTGS